MQHNGRNNRVKLGVKRTLKTMQNVCSVEICHFEIVESK